MCDDERLQEFAFTMGVTDNTPQDEVEILVRRFGATALTPIRLYSIGPPVALAYALFYRKQFTTLLAMLDHDGVDNGEVATVVGGEIACPDNDSRCVLGASRRQLVDLGTILARIGVSAVVFTVFCDRCVFAHLVIPMAYGFVCELHSGWCRLRWFMDIVCGHRPRAAALDTTHFRYFLCALALSVIPYTRNLDVPSAIECLRNRGDDVANFVIDTIRPFILSNVPNAIECLRDRGDDVANSVIDTLRPSILGNVSFLYALVSGLGDDVDGLIRAEFTWHENLGLIERFDYFTDTSRSLSSTCVGSFVYMAALRHRWASKNYRTLCKNKAVMQYYFYVLLCLSRYDVNIDCCQLILPYIHVDVLHHPLCVSKSIHNGN